MLSSRKSKFFLATCLCVLIFTLQKSFAQQDNYLEELDAEAGGLSLDRKTRDDAHIEKNIRDSAGLAAVPDGDSPENNGLPPGLSRDSFEVMLERNFFGSYLFYKRLNAASRAWVYRQYQEKPAPERVRKSILEAIKRQRGES